MRKRDRYHALFGLLCLFPMGLAFAKVDFADAAARRFGEEQIEFFEQFVESKAAHKSSPVKSLVSSLFAAKAGDSIPPLGTAGLEKNRELSGSLLIEYAESLYSVAQYQLASEVLAMMSLPMRQGNGARYDLLKLKLALQGVGKIEPVAIPLASGDPYQFNQVLALLKSGQVDQALLQLKSMASDQKLAVAVRHRATVWRAVLTEKSDAKQDVAIEIETIDGASPLLGEALLAYLRHSSKLSPGSAAVIENYFARAMPESSMRWEARDALISALMAAKAVSQAGGQAKTAVDSLNTLIERLDGLLEKSAKLPPSELLPLLDGLSDLTKSRTNELLKREASLRKALVVLRNWQPYMEVYLQKLQRAPEQFAAEIRGVVETEREVLRKGSGLADLFRFELTELAGSPPNRADAYRLFFGLSQWELGYEYPDNWRPSFDRQEPENAGKRRRQKEAAQMKEKLDQRMMPRAVGHMGKLTTKIEGQLNQQSSVVFKGVAERASDLARANREQISEIEKVLAAIPQGARSAIQEDVKSRRLVAQRWMNRFLGQLVTAHTTQKSEAPQPFFSLNESIVLKAGVPLVAAISSQALTSSMRTPSKIDVQPALSILKKLAQSGEDRNVRAEALRLGAEVTLELYESQKIATTSDAIDNYRALLSQYGDLIDKADFTYQLARAQDLGGRLNDSTDTLEVFAKQFSGDSRISEVLFRLGEASFAVADYSSARSYYESVLSGGVANHRDQAEYKLAWTLFKAGDYLGALPRFLAFLERSQRTADAQDNRFEERKKDSFRAVALTFAYMNGPVDVERYFARIGSRSYMPDIYLNLAKYYLDHERIKDAAETYSYLVKHVPNDPRAPQLLGQVVAGAKSESLNQLALDLQEKFIDTYATTNVYWAQANEGVRSEINGLMKLYLADFGQLYHADAQQTKNPASYAKAIKYYGQYVSTFPQDSQAPKYHFLMAEAKFDIGNLVGAKADYEYAAYQYPAHADAAAAGYASLIVTQKISELATLPEEKKARLRELVSGSGRFATAFPTDTRVDTVLVKSAEDMLMLGEPAEAVGYAEKLLERKPKDDVRRRALLVLSYGRFDSKDFANAEAALNLALVEKSISIEDRRKLLDRLGLAVYRQAEALSAAGNVEQAISTFLRVASAAPGAEGVANAEIDASVLLFQSKQWGRAVEVLERFMKNFSTHPLAAGVPTRLAFAYENDGKFLKAADLLETISRIESDDELARQMAWKAGELRDKGGRFDLAIATYERYLVRYPTPLERATEVRKMLADVAVKNDDIDTRDRWLKEIIAHAQGTEGVTPRVKFLAADANMIFGDRETEAFEAIALKLPLDKSLAAKRKALELSLTWYESASRFGVLEVTTAATYRIGELYRRLAKDVLASERPGGLNDLEKGQYNILLEEESFPFEEKSAEIHAINHQRLRTGTYDIWVDRSIASLRLLNPAKYDRVEMVKPYFEYVPPPKTDQKPDGKGAPATSDSSIRPPLPASTKGGAVDASRS